LPVWTSKAYIVADADESISAGASDGARPLGGRYPVPLDASDALFERTTRDRDLGEIKAIFEDLKR